jgi:HSP20 family protein
MKWGITNYNNSDVTRSTVFDDIFKLMPVDYYGGDLYPKVDVHEDEKAVYVKAELPGLDEKDLNITLKENILTIAGEKKEEKTEGEKDKNYWYCERVFGSFTRTFALPEGVKGDDVKATYKNGVLEIELPKSEAVQPKKINIKVN